MKSADVIKPLILRDAYPKDIAQAAAQEVIALCRSMDTLMKTPYAESVSPNVMNLWSLQGGMNIGQVQRPSLEAVYKIIAFMDDIIGYKCDPLESSLRVQLPESFWPKLPWHQDGAGMRKAKDSIVAWVPLNTIDGKCPTIEFSNSQMTSLLEHERNTNCFLEAENNGDAGSTIVDGLELGAVVIFSPWTLHRTYRTKDMTHARVSLDLRFYQ